MRAINSPLGANTNTWPSEACATNSRPAWSIVNPSGPLAPKVEQNRPTLETLPSFISGRRQTAFASHRDKQYSPAGIEHQPVRADTGVDQAVEPPVRRQAVDPPGRI